MVYQGRWICKKTNNIPPIAFYITVLRSILGLGLGVALLFQPDKARPILGMLLITAATLQLL